jgi:hypothetical protein
MNFSGRVKVEAELYRQYSVRVYPSWICYITVNMARYQPPHMRNRPPSADTPGESSNTPRQSTGPAQNGSRPASSISNSRPPRSNRDWSAPAGTHSSALGFARRDIRPSTRSDLHSRPERNGEDMEFIQSVSRSGGDGAEGDA